VSKSCWVDNDKSNTISGGLMNTVDQFMFGITLKAGQFMALY
jgi:hypothetical protein